MAKTFAQSQLTPPLASLQYLRPYTKDQMAALSPDESKGLFSLEALGQQYPGGMFGFGNSIDLVQDAFAQPGFVDKLRGRTACFRGRSLSSPSIPESMAGGTCENHGYRLQPRAALARGIS